jgi:hypothetical protein
LPPGRKRVVRFELYRGHGTGHTTTARRSGSMHSPVL